MDSNPVVVSDTESNNSNQRLHEVLQSALDLNIKAETIMSSTNSDRSGPKPEIECVDEIKVISRDSIIPCHSDRSFDSV